MTITMHDRAVTICGERLLEEIETTEIRLRSWVAQSAAAVRSLGPTAKTRATLSIGDAPNGVELECEFQGRNGDTYVVRAVATGALDLGAIDAELPDVPAAASAMGALLHELSMPNFLL